MTTTSKALALGDFDGDSKSQNQTSFKKGDVVTILNKISGGWWYGSCDRTGEKGYFPESFVKELDTEVTVSNVTATSGSGSAAESSATNGSESRCCGGGHRRCSDFTS